MENNNEYYWDEAQGDFCRTNQDSNRETSSNEKGTRTSPSSEQVIPDYIEPIVGHRGWYLFLDSQTSAYYHIQFVGWYLGNFRMSNYHLEPNKLHSLTVPFYWQPKKVIKSNIDKTEDGEHGYYSYNYRNSHSSYDNYSRNYGRNILKSWYSGSGEPIYVHGEVNLWGRIAVHDFGYRSEYAYPRNLIIFGKEVEKDSLAKEYNHIFKGIARDYGIPTITTDQWETKVKAKPEYQTDCEYKSYFPPRRITSIDWGKK